MTKDAEGRWFWTEQDAIANGLEPMPNVPATKDYAWSTMQRVKAHRALRHLDGLWHYYRYADPAKAEQRDQEMTGPLMPSREATNVK